MRKVGLFLSIMASAMFICSNSSEALDAYDSTTGNYIDIDSYDHKGKGEGPVEYYDRKTNEYKTGYLDLYSGGSGTLTDDETGESHEIQLEDDISEDEE